jgi:hypothetical protein
LQTAEEVIVEGEGEEEEVLSESSASSIESLSVKKNAKNIFILFLNYFIYEYFGSVPPPPFPLLLPLFCLAEGQRS